ncbi:MAG: DinB family protein [Deinococcota bacterium]
MATVYQMHHLADYPQEIGGWLWGLEDARKRTKQVIRGLDQAVLDWQGEDDSENAIGSLLYHLALVEMAWLYEDVLCQPDATKDYPQKYPWPMGSKGRLSPVLGISLEEHIARLDTSRATFLEHLKTVTLDDWGRLRNPEDTDYQVSPAWVLFHLVEHEASHTGQMSIMKKRAQKALAIS